ncbi:phage portal protein [Hungatella hominis]|nr:phage portal protein [Hungatella hominis]
MRKMGIIADWWHSIRGSSPDDWLEELELIETESKRLYLKKIAIDTVLNFVARIMSTATFRLTGPDSNNREWDYILNVRPNLDMSAAFFWQQVFYRLLFDNEVLVIFTEDNQLLIADGFVRREYALYEDVFEGVRVKDYCFQKSFRMSDVIYLEYNNCGLEEITKGLFKDYNELFGRMMEVAMRNNQIRASVTVDVTGTTNEKGDAEGKTRSQRLQGFIDKIYESFRTNSVAIVPKMKGFEYEEYTNKTQVSNQSVEELTNLKKSLIDDVSRIIGAPSALIHGELSELEHNIKALRRICMEPLVKKLEDELNAKLFQKTQVVSGNRLEVWGVLPYDLAEMAAQIDKLVSSGAFYVDEIRNELEYDELPNGEGKKIIRTKNYEETEGGEKK